MPVSMFGYVFDYKRDELSVDRVADLIALEFPELWKLVYTKHIDTPGNYVGVKHVAVACASVILHLRAARGSENATACNTAIAVGVLAKYDYPTYFVGKELMQALMNTHPPKASTWKDVVWPFPAMVFMLPKGVLHEPDTGHEINFVGVANLPDMDGICIPTLPNIRLNRCWEDNEGRVTIFYGVDYCTCIQDTTFPQNRELEVDPIWIREMSEKYREKFISSDTYAANSDPTFSSMLSGLVANFLLVMQARKELVEGGTGRAKCLKSGVASFSPTFIGRKYQAVRQYPKGEAMGHYTEIGWRAGHMKRQHFGQGRKDEKLVWVDPYIAFTKGLKKVAQSS